MYIGNKNVIPAISNLPGQGNPGAGPVPSNNFILMEGTGFVLMEDNSKIILE